MTVPSEFDAAPALAAHIARYWGLVAPAGPVAGTLISLPPDGMVLLAQLSARGMPRATLVGPRAEPLALPLLPGERVWAVRCWPDTGGLLLGVDAEELAGHVVSPLDEPDWILRLLEELRGARDASAAAAAMNHVLEPVVAALPAIDAAVRAAVQALIVTHGEIGIAELAEGVGLSLRQLERRFLSAVGLNPVQYAKVRKMRGEALPLLAGASLAWNDIAPALASARP